MNYIVILITLYAMMFIVHLINGNMIGRHDGMRANSLCMVRLSRLSRLILFLSPHKKYNVWSVLAQSITLLYLCFSVATQMINANAVKEIFRPCLISFIVIHSTLFVCLFIDIMVHDSKHRNRF